MRRNALLLLALVVLATCFSVEAAPCTLNKRQFTKKTYFAGKRLKQGSIYALCIKGKPVCFEDDGSMDRKTRKMVPDCANAIQAANAKFLAKARALKAKSQAKSQAKPKSRELAVTRHSDGMWPHGVICYEIGSLAPSQQTLLETAMRRYETTFGLDFVKIDDCRGKYGRTRPDVCGGCTQRVVIRNNEEDCHSTVGYSPDDNLYMNMEVGECDLPHTYLHEIGHVIGMEHEHQHPRRQIIVLRDELLLDIANYDVNDPDDERTLDDVLDDPDNREIFDYLKLLRSDVRTTPYDLRSIMHYDGHEFCLPTDPSLRYCDVDGDPVANNCVAPVEAHCNRARQREIGRAADWSAGDIEAIRQMYPGLRPAPASSAPASP